MIRHSFPVHRNVAKHIAATRSRQSEPPWDNKHPGWTKTPGAPKIKCKNAYQVDVDNCHAQIQDLDTEFQDTYRTCTLEEMCILIHLLSEEKTDFRLKKVISFAQDTGLLATRDLFKSILAETVCLKEGIIALRRVSAGLKAQKK